MDENGYPDVVVGAYDSSKTLLLRSRPVVQITAMVQVRSIITFETRFVSDLI